MVLLYQFFVCAFVVVGLRLRHHNRRFRIDTSAIPAPQTQARDLISGDSRKITPQHPVIQVIIDRWLADSKPGGRAIFDNHKVALSIEGGGMRGCVAAGQVAAINFLGLQDSIDVVYGSSAGAMVGAYFVSRQFSGVQIYHGKMFINKLRILAAMGIPAWIFKLAAIGRFMATPFTSPSGKGKRRRKRAPWTSTLPNGQRATKYTQQSGSSDSITSASECAPAKDVLNLDFLLLQVMGGFRRLDWKTFQENDRRQPLRVVASSLASFEPVIFSRKAGNFHDLSSLLACIRASMWVPGLTGPQLFGIHNRSSTPRDVSQQYASSNDLDQLFSLLGHCNESSPDTDASLPWSLAGAASSSMRGFGLRFGLLQGRQRDLTLGSLHRAYTKRAMPRGSTARAAAPRSLYDSHAEPTSLLVTPSYTAVGSAAAATQLSHLGSSSLLEPLADACICEPIPYRSAVAEGATHVLVLRTRPDGIPVGASTAPASFSAGRNTSVSAPFTSVHDPDIVPLKSAGVYERFIAKRYLELHAQNKAADFMTDMRHLRIYAEDRHSKGTALPGSLFKTARASSAVVGTAASLGWNNLGLGARMASLISQIAGLHRRASIAVKAIWRWDWRGVINAFSDWTNPSQTNVTIASVSDGAAPVMSTSFLVNREINTVLIPETAASSQSAAGGVLTAHLLQVAPCAGCREVNQLETDRSVILEGMRDGARRIFEIFLPAMRIDVDMEEASEDMGEGQGPVPPSLQSVIEDMVRMVFPDSILDRDIPMDVLESLRLTEIGDDNTYPWTKQSGGMSPQ